MLDDIIRVLIFITFSAAFGAVALVLGREAIKIIAGAEVVILPMKITAQDNGVVPTGEDLSLMLKGQLGEVSQRIRAWHEIEYEAPTNHPSSSTDINRGQEESPRQGRSGLLIPEEIAKVADIPTSILQPVGDLNFKVAGIEAGGFLNYFYRWFISPRYLEFTLYIKDKKAIILGDLRALTGKPRDFLRLVTEIDPDRLTRNLAHALVLHRIGANQDTRLVALDADEFSQFIDMLNKLARLNQFTKLNRIDRQGYEKYSTRRKIF